MRIGLDPSGVMGLGPRRKTPCARGRKIAQAFALLPSLSRVFRTKDRSRLAPGIDDSDTFHAFHTAHRNGENSRLRDTVACGPPSLPGVITAPQPRAKRAAINELGPQRIERDALRIATGHLEVTLSTRPLGCEDGQCFVGGEIELRHLSAEISIRTFYTATPKTGKTWLIGARANKPDDKLFHRVSALRAAHIGRLHRRNSAG